MVKTVVGVYGTSFEALGAINSLKEDGIQKQHILVIAHDEYETSILEKKAGVAVDQGINLEQQKKSVLQSLRSLFSSSSSNDYMYTNYLMDIGLDKEDAEIHSLDVKSGKILVLLDKKYDREKPETDLSEVAEEMSNNPVNNALEEQRVASRIESENKLRAESLNDVDRIKHLK